MARKKKGEPVTGWLVLDKPEGVTSTQAVGICRRVFNAQKAGHGGTLDPLASGILPIAFGEATADGETPEKALQSTLKQLVDMAEIKTSAETPDWKEGDPRPTEPTGLFIGTKYQRDEYLAEKTANRRMLCHMIYALSTQCVIYVPSDGATGYATELYMLQS